MMLHLLTLTATNSFVNGVATGYYPVGYHSIPNCQQNG